MEMVNNLQAFVSESIDTGVTNIENVHKRIASMPLDFMAKIDPLHDLAEGAKEIQERSIGNVYETVRLVNGKVGEMTSRLLGKETADSQSQAA